MILVLDQGELIGMVEANVETVGKLASAWNEYASKNGAAIMAKAEALAGPVGEVDNGGCVSCATLKRRCRLHDTIFRNKLREWDRRVKSGWQRAADEVGHTQGFKEWAVGLKWVEVEVLDVANC